MRSIAYVQTFNGQIQIQAATPTSFVVGIQLSRRFVSEALDQRLGVLRGA
jgi:hypothetical protein